MSKLIDSTSVGPPTFTARTPFSGPTLEWVMSIAPHSVGTKDFECAYCGFKRYEHEKNMNSRCCSRGQWLVVDASDHEEWEEELASLFRGDGYEARLRRKYSRHLANSVALASIQTSKKSLLRTGASHVFMNGKVYTKFDSLRARHGTYSFQGWF